MSESADGKITRLFAQAAVPGGDEGFVAGIAAEVARRRATRRSRRVALLELPDQVGAAAASARHLPGASYLGIALLIVVLPLAGAAWLSRRA